MGTLWKASVCAAVLAAAGGVCAQPQPAQQPQRRPNAQPPSPAARPARPAQPAKPPLRPGLWELVRHNVTVDGRRLQNPAQQLQTLPPDVRRHTGEMLSRQGVDTAPGAPRTQKICLTPEALARIAWTSQRADCRPAPAGRKGDAWLWRSTCGNPVSTTEGSTRFGSNNFFVSHVKVTSTLAGRPHVITLTTAGRFVTSQCGDVRSPQ